MAANTYYGKNGILRLYDGTRGRDLSLSAPIQVRVATEISAVFADITSNAVDPTVGSNTILAVNTDRVYVGQIFQHSKVTVDVTTPASADTGLMVVEYWNGSAWVAVSNMVDGTKVGVNTMRQDGVISWDIPSDWAKNDPPTSGTTLYYIRFHTTTSPATDPVVQLFEPSSGQFITLIFSSMNFTGPQGRARPEEILRLNRGQLDSNTHYVQGLDDPIESPVRITFSCLLESGINKTALMEAIVAGSAGITSTWPMAGTSTKTTSKLPAGLTGNLFNTCEFTDPIKKTVDVQCMWDDRTGSRVHWVWSEVYFDPQNQTLNEDPASVTVNLSGDCYGSINNNGISSLGLEVAA